MMFKNKRKIKIYIKTKDHLINLPKLSIKKASFVFKLGIRHNERFVKKDSNLPVVINQNRHELLNLIDMMIDIIEDCEPFVLVDARSGDERVLIEVL